MEKKERFQKKRINHNVQNVFLSKTKYCIFYFSMYLLMFTMSCKERSSGPDMGLIDAIRCSLSLFRGIVVHGMDY